MVDINRDVLVAARVTPGELARRRGFVSGTRIGIEIDATKELTSLSRLRARVARLQHARPHVSRTHASLRASRGVAHLLKDLKVRLRHVPGAFGSDARVEE